MDRNYFIELTINLYRATDAFLDEEPLKFILRKKAAQILEKLSPHHFSENSTISLEEATQVRKEIQSLCSLLKVAEVCEGSDQLTFFLLREEYERIDKELSQISSLEDYISHPVEEVNNKNEIGEAEELLSERQRKILSFLRHQPNLKTDEIAAKFSGVSARTIRRDLDVLLQKRLVLRRRAGKSSFYQINPVDKT